MNCEGYKKILLAVERDEKESPNFHDYRAKLDWVVKRANHYADKTGLKAEEILDAWEAKRDYWYMNFYQECNQPEIKGGNVRVFDTVKDLLLSIGKEGFRCPLCSGVSKSPYECTTGLKIKKKVCDWKVYGLLGDLGKGVNVFVKEKLASENLFMPIAWEDATMQRQDLKPNEQE